VPSSFVLRLAQGCELDEVHHPSQSNAFKFDSKSDEKRQSK
jgi:hypothetical protein